MVAVTAVEAQSKGLPPIGFQVDATGTSLSLTTFPEPDKYLIASGPPGGPLLAIVWATDASESHAGAIEGAIYKHFSQRWQQPLVVGELGQVEIAGAARLALSFTTGQAMRRTAWCGVLVGASLFVTFGRALGQAPALSCADVMSEPSLVAFARSFTLLP